MKNQTAIGLSFCLLGLALQVPSHSFVAPTGRPHSLALNAKCMTQIVQFAYRASHNFPDIKAVARAHYFDCFNLPEGGRRIVFAAPLRSPEIGPATESYLLNIPRADS
jgi:hypothetical protein